MEPKTIFAGNSVIITAKINPDFIITIIDKEFYGTKIDGQVWDSKYVNDLPDTAFAIVHRVGGSKIRKLVHHNKSVSNGSENSSVDKPHLRNALARVSQVEGIPAEVKASAKAHLSRHAKVLLQ